jgi:hypothetical protein
MPNSTKVLLAGALALAASAAVATAATNSTTPAQAREPSASVLAADDIANLAANPAVPSQEAVGTNNGRIHISTKFTYANDYWFRYRDIAPNRFNLMNNSKLDVNLGTIGDVYLKTFADFSSNIKKPYLNGFAQNRAGVGGGDGGSDGYMPSSDFTSLFITVGYHHEFMNLLGFDTGYRNFITPITAVDGDDPFGVNDGDAVVGHKQTSQQEWFFKFTLNDQRFLGCFALHPYVYIGLDFGSAYYTSGAGQYWEIGINPRYVIPNTGGLAIHPYWNMSFISGEKRLDVSSVGGVANYRDGYLGTTVGVGASYPLNGVLHIPAGYGTYSVGAFVEGVFAGTRYQQPTGSHSDATVAGMDIAMNY